MKAGTFDLPAGRLMTFTLALFRSAAVNLVHGPLTVSKTKTPEQRVLRGRIIYLNKKLPLFEIIGCGQYIGELPEFAPFTAVAEINNQPDNHPEEGA